MRMLSHSLGVGVFIIHEGKVILGKRLNTGRGNGMLAVPGGHVEADESVHAAVLREVDEETGMDVMFAPAVAAFATPGVIAVTDHADPAQQQNDDFISHLTLWIATYWKGEYQPVNKEPHRNEKWEWRDPLHPSLSVRNPNHPQYYWTPTPLWEQILPQALSWTYDRMSSRLVPWPHAKSRSPLPCASSV